MYDNYIISVFGNCKAYPSPAPSGFCYAKPTSLPEGGCGKIRFFASADRVLDIFNMKTNLFQVILEQKSAKHFSDTQSVVGRERAKNLVAFPKKATLIRQANGDFK